jgi:hypothetical protein
MTTQQNDQIGHDGYTAEELHAIVRRAHRERAQALREIVTRLFTRRKAAAEEPGQLAHRDAVACR